jgi:hypothetical protein
MSAFLTCCVCEPSLSLPLEVSTQDIVGKYLLRTNKSELNHHAYILRFERQLACHEASWTPQPNVFVLESKGEIFACCFIYVFVLSSLISFRFVS